MYKLIASVSMLVAINVSADTTYESGYITNIEKITRSVVKAVPYEECQVKEFYRETSSVSDTDRVMGTILGGIIGNQFGGGSGKDAMTVAGAVLGNAMAGDGKTTGELVEREVCTKRFREERVEEFAHYIVSYEYNGRGHQYRTRQKPTSKHIELKVAVSPR